MELKHRLIVLYKNIPLISKVVFLILCTRAVIEFSSIVFFKTSIVDSLLPKSFMWLHNVLIAPLLVLIGRFLDTSWDNTLWFQILIFVGIIIFLPVFWATLAGVIWHVIRLVSSGRLPTIIKQHKKISVTVITLLAIIIFWLPWLVINHYNQFYILNNGSPNYKYIIVFGGKAQTDGSLSEINQERLLAAKFLANRSTITADAKIIVSNSGLVTDQMKTVLVEQGIADTRIEIDDTADTTAATCHHAIEQGLSGKSVVFVSHGYHLPRVIYQCRKIGLRGFGFAAESLSPIDRASLPVWKVGWIRSVRTIREAALSWLVLLHIYR